MDDVRVYNRVLLQEELTALYEMGNSTKYPSSGLVALYTFNDNSTTAAYDYTGNGNIGVINGVAALTASVLGKSLLFDGVNDYVKISNNFTSGFTQLAIST